MFDKLEKWQKICGTLIVTAAVITGSWNFMNSQFMPRAEAASDKAAILARWIEKAEMFISQLEDEQIELKYNRPDLDEVAREKLIAKRQRQIAEEDRKVTCWKVEKRLDC